MRKSKSDIRREQEMLLGLFNHPIGTVVRYWKLDRNGEPSGTGPTRSEAYMSDSGHAVVFIEGCSGYVCLSHVEVVRG
jgi:hypothetical protein